MTGLQHRPHVLWRQAFSFWGLGTFDHLDLVRPVDRIPKIPSIPLLISFLSIECNTGIIAASIRSMRPLSILFERLGFSSNTQSEKKGYYIG